LSPFVTALLKLQAVIPKAKISLIDAPEAFEAAFVQQCQLL
jgi:hypothetical protein